MKNYLMTHEQEATGMMMALFNEAYIQDAYGHERQMEGEKKGRMEGKREERIRSILGMKEAELPDELIAKAMKISLSEVRKILQAQPLQAN